MGLFDIFSSSSGKKAANAANQATVSGLNKGYNQASSALDSGLQTATDYYKGASDLYDTWAGTGKSANTMFGNALGLNGADGNTAAVDAFRAGPGYQFQVDQATQAAQRAAASSGMLGSGNTLMAVSDRTRSLADTEFQNWLNNLNTASGAGLQATGAQAGIQTGIGDMNYKTGAAKGDLAWQKETGIGAANAQKFADIHAANQSASGNVWSAILGVGDLASRFMGGRSV